MSSGRLAGGARVSSVGQSLDIQLGKLKDCQKIFQEGRAAPRTSVRR